MINWNEIIEQDISYILGIVLISAIIGVVRYELGKRYDYYGEDEEV